MGEGGIGCARHGMDMGMDTVGVEVEMVAWEEQEALRLVVVVVLHVVLCLALPGAPLALSLLLLLLDVEPQPQHAATCSRHPPVATVHWGRHACPPRMLCPHLAPLRPLGDQWGGGVIIVDRFVAHPRLVLHPVPVVVEVAVEVAIVSTTPTPPTPCWALALWCMALEGSSSPLMTPWHPLRRPVAFAQSSRGSRGVVDEGRKGVLAFGVAMTGGMQP